MTCSTILIKTNKSSFFNRWCTYVCAPLQIHDKRIDSAQIKGPTFEQLMSLRVYFYFMGHLESLIDINFVWNQLPRWLLWSCKRADGIRTRKTHTYSADTTKYWNLIGSFLISQVFVDYGQHNPIMSALPWARILVGVRICWIAAGHSKSADDRLSSTKEKNIKSWNGGEAFVELHFSFTLAIMEGSYNLNAQYGKFIRRKVSVVIMKMWSTGNNVSLHKIMKMITIICCISR